MISVYVLMVTLGPKKFRHCMRNSEIDHNHQFLLRIIESALHCKLLSMLRKAILQAEMDSDDDTPPCTWLKIASDLKEQLNNSKLEQKRRLIKMTNSPELKSHWISESTPQEVLDIIYYKDVDYVDSELLSLCNQSERVLRLMTPKQQTENYQSLLKQRLIHPKQTLNELDAAFTKAIGSISLFGLKMMNTKDERKPDYFYERGGKIDEVFYVDIRKPIKSNAVYKMRNDGVSL